MDRENARRRVVVTGYGAVTPLGPDTETTFERASRGESGIGPITAFDAVGLPCDIAGEVPDDGFGPGAFPLADLSPMASRGAKLAWEAARQAAEQAQLDGIPARHRIGLFLGTFGENQNWAQIQALYRMRGVGAASEMNGLRAARDYDCMYFFRRKPDIAAFLLAEGYDCRGPICAFGSACAAGAQAVGEAYRIIQAGKADVMMAGGCEAPITLVGFLGFLLLRALVERYEDPQSASRPFDRKRNGFVLSEGAGILVLEAREHACSRGARVFGEVMGYGASLDAFRITDVPAHGEGAALAIRAALEEANLSPGEVDYINAHGTATVQNDLAETRAIKAVFGRRARDLPVSSHKSMLGHTVAAAGPIEMILTLEGMRKGLILPTINLTSPDPACDLWYVPHEAVRRPHGRALSNSFGFGGHNVCLCIGLPQGEG